MRSPKELPSCMRYPATTRQHECRQTACSPTSARFDERRRQPPFACARVDRQRTVSRQASGSRARQSGLARPASAKASPAHYILRSIASLCRVTTVKVRSSAARAFPFGEGPEHKPWARRRPCAKLVPSLTRRMVRSPIAPPRFPVSLTDPRSQRHQVRHAARVAGNLNRRLD